MGGRRIKPEGKISGMMRFTNNLDNPKKIIRLPSIRLPIFPAFNFGCSFNVFRRAGCQFWFKQRRTAAMS